MEAATCKKDLVIEIPVDVVEREAEKITAQYRRLARLPGFRPGHAPASLVRTHFRSDIRNEIVQSLLPKAFENAVREQKLSVVGTPSFEDLKFDDHQPLSCKASFEVLPDFELKDTQGLEVEEAAAAVTDADVDEALENLRQHSATLTVLEGEPAAEGDFLTVNYRGRDAADAAAKPREVKDAVLHIGGKGTVAEFTENLRGARVGEGREFDVTYPENFGEKTLAGKTLRYQVKVEGIKRRVIPPLDDELAKSASEFQTLGELRQDLREDLEKAAVAGAEMKTKEKLLEKLLEMYSFPVPETLIEAQVQRKFERALAGLMAQGIDPRSVNADWAKIKEESRPEAERDTRAALILEKIAEREKMEVSEEELDEAIRKRAEGAQVPAAQLKSRLTRDGGLDKLKSSLRSQKALDTIYRSAKIIRKTQQPAPMPPERTE